MFRAITRTPKTLNRYAAAKSKGEEYTKEYLELAKKTVMENEEQKLNDEKCIEMAKQLALFPVKCIAGTCVVVFAINWFTEIPNTVKHTVYEVKESIKELRADIRDVKELINKKN